MQEIIIKEYNNECKEAIFSLILDIQQKEFGFPINREDQPDVNDIENFYQSGRGNFWVAFAGNIAVGTIALIDIGDNKGALRKMYVKKEYRGSSYNTAKLLLQGLLDWAKEKGMNEVFLGTTDRYLAAHRFYEKNGFALLPKEELPESFPIMAVDSIFYTYRV